MIKSGVLHVLKYAFLKAQHSLRMPSRNLRFLLYLEWSREVNFFCFLQAQSNEGNVGRISEGNKDKYVADLCNPYDINSQQSKHMIAGQQDLSFF